MATRTRRARSDRDELAHFVLKNVEGLKKDSGEAGQGAYGVIYNVTVNGLQCVAKRLHKALVDEVEDSETMKKKFRNECIILSRLKHPNLVHFIGVHYGKEKGDITLIMECLTFDLNAFLKKHPQVPLPLKMSILLDVSYGLLYLHTHDPPIVHRDLTDRNILITSDARAKIADLGMAKLLTPQALNALDKHTKVPGRPSYMPPETQTENPECTPKIDIFSFGCLSLFIINEEDPHAFEVIDLPKAAKKQGGVQVLRRRPSVEKVGPDHCMYSLITQCLHDNPTQRPETVELTEKLHELCMKHPQAAGLEDIVALYKGTFEPKEVLSMKQQQSKLQKDLYEAQSQLETLEVTKKELLAVKEEVSSTKAENEDLRDQMYRLSTAFEGLNNLQKEVFRLENENTELKRQLQTTQDKLQTTQAQVMVFEKDFADERRDREAAHSKLADLEKELEVQKTLFNEVTMDYKHQISTAHQDMDCAKKELEQAKKELAKKQNLTDDVDFWRNQAATLKRQTQEMAKELEKFTTHSTDFQKKCQDKDNQTAEDGKEIEGVTKQKMKKKELSLKYSSSSSEQNTYSKDKDLCNTGTLIY